jgi:hypothetical protein
MAKLVSRNAKLSEKRVSPKTSEPRKKLCEYLFQAMKRKAFKQRYFLKEGGEVR